MSMPPTKPTLPVLEASAAAMPTRKLPSCSLNTTDCDVGLLDHRIDDHELLVRELGGDGLQRGREGEAHRDHDVGPLRHAAQRLVALALVGDLELEIADAGLVLELLGAVIGGLVERLVELAAHVEDDGRREVRRAWTAAPSVTQPDRRQEPRRTRALQPHPFRMHRRNGKRGPALAKENGVGPLRRLPY